MSTVLRRKVVRPRPQAVAEPEGSAILRALPRALMRAIGDGTGLAARAGRVSQRSLALDEALDCLPDDGFVALLGQGGGAGPPGLLVLGADLFAGLIEAMTLGRLAPAPSTQARRPTGTDSALLGAMMDRMLADLGDSDGRPWQMLRVVGDLRLLAAILDDLSFDVLETDVRLVAPGSDDARRGGALMLLLPPATQAPVVAPFAVSGRGPAVPPEPAPDAFAAALEAAVAGAPVVLTAVLDRVALPLDRALALALGDRLELPLARLEEVEVLGLDGQPQLRARLGQSQGQRALRITTIGPAQAGLAAFPEPAEPER